MFNCSLTLLAQNRLLMLLGKKDSIKRSESMQYLPAVSSTWRETTITDRMDKAGHTQDFHVWASHA